MGVYVNGNMQVKLDDLGEWMEEREGGVRVVIVGSGVEGGEEEGRGEGSRRSTDKEVIGE